MAGTDEQVPRSKPEHDILMLRPIDHLRKCHRLTGKAL